MADVKGLGKLTANIKRKIAKAQRGTVAGKAQGIVGYDIYYAIFVHEDLEKYHPVGKAKFLVDPYLRMKPGIVRSLKYLMKRGKSLPEAIMILLERLKKESNKEVPVDTGALMASSYTKLEVGSI